MYYIIKFFRFYTGIAWTEHKSDAEIYDKKDAEKLSKKLDAEMRLEWNNAELTKRLNEDNNENNYE